MPGSMKVSRRSHVPPFAVMEVLAEANRLRDAGASVLNLCAGEPSTGASDVVRRRAIELLEHGDLGYTESLGVPTLRRAIAEHYDRWYGVEIDPARVAVTTALSAEEAAAIAIFAQRLSRDRSARRATSGSASGRSSARVQASEAERRTKTG